MRVKIFLLICFLLTPVTAYCGQSNSTKSGQSEQVAVVPAMQDLAEEHARVTAHIEEASKQLIEAKHALETPDPLRKDKEEQALQERVDLAQARIQLGRRHLKVVRDVQVIRDERKQLQEEFTSWTGFAESPPYSFALVEEIARHLKSQLATIKTEEMYLASFTHGNALALEEMETAKKTFRQTLEELESAINDEAKQQARKKHAMSQLALQVSEEGVAFVRASNQVLQEKLGLNRVREEFLRKKLSVAQQSVQLTREVLQTKIDDLTKELTAAGESLATINASQTTANQQLESVRQRIDAVQKRKEQIDPLHNLELQLRQKQLEMILATVDDVNLHIAYLQLMQEYWRKFFNLLSNWDLAAARPLLDEFEKVLPVVDEGISAMVLAGNEIEDFELERRFMLPELAESRNAVTNAVGVRSERLSAARRSAQQLLDSIHLWKQIVKMRVGTMKLGEQAQGWEDILLGYLQRIWSFEILSVEDILVVDGQRIVEHRPVTIGKVVQAVLILTIGLWFASWLAGLFSRIVFPFSMMQGQRRLLIEKILRIGMIVGVVVLALITVKIPLTVFAFLGGAIALGLGFGAKNLLNNFIGGFILLGESSIRVGDRIELEGNEGIVKLIGYRCTRVRRLDGVEILIPNSQLLERSVTNMTLSDRYLRKTIKVGVAYGSPTREVHALLLAVVRGNDQVVVDPPPVVVFEDFGNDALIFSAYFWLDLASLKDFREVISELRHALSERLAEKGFEMAFPQRDVHLSVKTPLAVNVRTLSDPE